MSYFLVLPDVSFQFSISFTTQSVIIGATYTDNSQQSVIRFHVTVNGQIYTLTSFPLLVDISEFIIGQTYSVTVMAENVIGNATVATTSFTIPGKIIIS